MVTAGRVAPAAVRALVLASHPIPTVAVTAMGTALAGLAHLSPPRIVLVGLAILAGQLSIGWSNDRIDAGRDRESRRTDKPLAAGALPLAVVSVAVGVALVVAVPLSLALGYRAGAAALLIVVCGWLYNLGLKASWWSWLPYALAFGALPAVATLARPDHPWPAAWAMAAGALLGVSAHFANVLPDLRADAATGVRGLPHRMGARASVIAGPVLLLAATVAIVFGASGRIGVARWTTLAVAVVVAAVAVTAGLSDRGNRSASRTYFLATVLVAVADIVLFAVSGGRLF